MRKLLRFVKCNIHAESNDITSNKNGFVFVNTSIICVAFDESFLGKKQNLTNEPLTPFKLSSVVWVEKAKNFHTETTSDHRDIKKIVGKHPGLRPGWIIRMVTVQTPKMPIVLLI